MNEKIDGFSKGIFKYARESITFSVDRLIINAEEGSVYTGSFSFKTSVEGNIEVSLCCDDFLMKLNNAHYSKGEGDVDFSYDATYLSLGTKRTAVIHFISNVGEFDIYADITVVKSSFTTSLGKISDLFQFAGLARTSTQEALKVFLDERFKDVFIKDNKEERLVYESLIKSASGEHAMEEFLLYVKKKMPVKFTCEKQGLEYHLARRAVKDHLIIRRSSWGCVDAKVSVDGSFVTLEKDIISESDFVGGSYELPILIDPGKMREGRNACKLRVTCGIEELCIDITAFQSDKKPVKASLNYKRKAYAIKLIKNYMQYRMGKMNDSQYVSSNRAVIYGLQVIDDSLLLELASIHLNMVAGKDKESVAAMTRLDKAIAGGSELEKTLADYLRHRLAPEDERLKEKCIDRLTRMMASHPKDWWYMTMFLSASSPKIKLPIDRLRFLKDMFDSGMRSGALYIEAWDLFKEDPTLFTRLTAFEVQVFNWSRKNDLFDSKLTSRFIYHAENLKIYDPIIYEYLKESYIRMPSDAGIASICSQALCKGSLKAEDFEWFRLGVEHGLKLEGLYEGYMETACLSDCEKLESQIYTYFCYDNELQDRIKAYLFSRVISIRRERAQVFQSYLPQIVDFATQMMKQGKIDKNLAVIYEELLKDDNYCEKVVALLPGIIFKREIKCEYNNISAVCVRSHEITGEQTEKFANGLAYIDSIDDSAMYFLVDTDGNRYVVSVDYEVRKLLNRSRLADSAYRGGCTDGRLLLNRALMVSRYHKHEEDISQLYEKIAEIDNLSPYYRAEVYFNLIIYYYDHFEGNLLEEYLCRVDMDFLPHDERMQVMELLMMRDLHDEAIASIKKYGYYGISIKYLLRLAQRLVADDDEKEREFVLNLSWYVFDQGKADETIVSYLEKYFNGGTAQNIAIWQTMREMGINGSTLPARTLEQMLLSENIPPGSAVLFKEYYNRCVTERNVTGRKLIRAFLAYEAYRYLVSDDALDDMLFTDMREEIFYDGNDICKMAALKYYSRKRNITEEEMAFAKTYMGNAAKKGNVLPFFNNFAGKCEVPAEARNRSFVVYVAEPSDVIYIHYRVLTDDEDRDWTTERMEYNYHGIFIKDFVLFYGETVQYYISMVRDDEAGITESQVLTITESEEGTEFNSNEDEPYQLINLLLMAKEIGDDVTVHDLARQIIGRDRATNKLFRPL